jgi:hypothetical protein
MTAGCCLVSSMRCKVAVDGADCPEHVYGPKKTLYNRFVRWAERGIWEGIFSKLAGVDGVPDRLFIDSTCIKAMGDSFKAYFYRTANGAEIDLVLVKGGVPDIAIDVKRSSAPTVERGFHTACDDLGIKSAG